MKRVKILEKIRVAARAKLENVITEVVERHSAEAQVLADRRHSELLSHLDGVHANLERLLAGMEHRARRDLFADKDASAVSESAAFVVDHMPTARSFPHPHDTLRHALGLVDGPGLALEFGVAAGTTLAIIADALGPAGRPVTGFDVFTGLPEDWRTGFAAGEFAQTQLPEVPGARLVAGLFEDTLPDFLAENSDPVAFLHLDADLHSSTATVLRLLGDRLRPGSVIVFDEFFNYPGWQAHEYRAWSEFTEKSGLEFDLVGYTADNEQVIAVVR